MMSTTTPDKVEAETVPSGGTAEDHAAVPAGPRPLPTPGRTQQVDEAAQEEAAEERAEGGGYN